MNTFLSASNLSKTSTNTSSRIIASNSIYDVLTVEDTIFKLESTNDYSMIQISVKATKSMNILVQQSFSNIIVGGVLPSLVSTEVFAVVPENPINGGTPARTFYATVTYPYFRIVLINTAEQAGNVYLTTKLIASVTTEGGTISTVNPTDDGVRVYGSADGVTPIGLLTDTAGHLVLNDVSPVFDGIPLQIKGNNDLIIPQTNDGRIKIKSVNGLLEKDNTLSDIYASTVVNTTNTTEELINFYTPAPTTTYQVFNAGDIIPSTSVDTNNVYTVMAMGEFLTSSENPPSTILPQFNISRRNPANDIFSIQSNLGLDAFAGKTIYPLNGTFTTGTFTVLNPGDSGMTIGYIPNVNLPKLSFNISTPFNANDYSSMRDMLLTFTTASTTYTGRINAVLSYSISGNRVSLEFTATPSIDLPTPPPNPNPNPPQFPIISLTLTQTTTSRNPIAFCPPTTLINSSAASSGGFCAINTVPVNLTNSGFAMAQVRGSTLYIFTPTYQAFITTPPAYDATNQLAFEYSNDNSSWFGGDSVPTFSLLTQTLPPIPYEVPYSRFIYNFSIQTSYIFARYIRIKAVKKMLLRLNYQVVGQKIRPNPLRLI